MHHKQHDASPITKAVYHLFANQTILNLKHERQSWENPIKGWGAWAKWNRNNCLATEEGFMVGQGYGILKQEQLDASFCYFRTNNTYWSSGTDSQCSSAGSVSCPAEPSLSTESHLSRWSNSTRCARPNNNNDIIDKWNDLIYKWHANAEILWMRETILNTS